MCSKTIVAFVLFFYNSLHVFVIKFVTLIFFYKSFDTIRVFIFPNSFALFESLWLKSSPELSYALQLDLCITEFTQRLLDLELDTLLHATRDSSALTSRDRYLPPKRKLILNVHSFVQQPFEQRELCLFELRCELFMKDIWLQQEILHYGEILWLWMRLRFFCCWKRPFHIG